MNHLNPIKNNPIKNNQNKNNIDNSFKNKRKIIYNPNDYKHLTKKELKSWRYIHKLAIKAVNDKLKLSFEKYMWFLAYNFPCPRCRPHIKQQLIRDPIINYYNKQNGIALWSWKFHNSVNKRLGKKETSWYDFKKKYLFN